MVRHEPCTPAPLRCRDRTAPAPPSPRPQHREATGRARALTRPAGSPPGARSPPAPLHGARCRSRRSSPDSRTRGPGGTAAPAAAPGAPRPRPRRSRRSPEPRAPPPSCAAGSAARPPRAPRARRGGGAAWRCGRGPASLTALPPSAPLRDGDSRGLCRASAGVREPSHSDRSDPWQSRSQRQGQSLLGQKPLHGGPRHTTGPPLGSPHTALAQSDQVSSPVRPQVSHSSVSDVSSHKEIYSPHNNT
ncbi:uncharacterized protein LOC115914989 [Camarhynchus parvulus]|uniref:uncharacterized protein LOC115914989 n=1 Tax=Geospiza parvula TaxID=87175 RepID=UPI001237AB53|nr:uncharacterized protein LOC115914989 [Camarhynchus parvulus]